MKTAFKILSFIIIIAILGVGVWFLLKHTDNFSSDFTTFYVEYENHHLAAESDTVYLINSTHRFDIVYTFDFLDKEQKGYSVKVIPNANAEDLDYVIDGRYYLFKGLSDITAAFDIELNETYFTLKIPKKFSVKTVLDRIYPDKTVEIDETYIVSDAPYYTLIITSNDGTKQYIVNFGTVDGKVKGVSLDITRIEF